MGESMDNDRAYVLRYRLEGSQEDECISVSTFDITEYECGLKAGDKVRLRTDLKVLDDDEQETGCVYKAGEVWTVLTGSSQDPETLWLRQADGELHSWDDDYSIFEQFERVKETGSGVVSPN